MTTVLKQNNLQAMQDAFVSPFPEKLQGQRKLGLEIEFPIVYKDSGRKGYSVRLQDTLKLFETIEKSTAESDPHYSLSHDGKSVEMKLADGRSVEVKTDYGTGLLEINFPPAPTLKNAEREMNGILNPIIEIAERNGISILGYGAQPFSNPGKDIVMPKERYDAIMGKFKDGWGVWFSVIAALHTHADIARSELVDALNVLNSLSPAIIALCGNSSVTCGIKNGYSDYRGIVWDNANFKKYTRRNADRKGVAPEFSDIDAYWKWFIGKTPVLTRRSNPTGRETYYAFQGVKSMEGFLRKGRAKVKDLDTGEMNYITPEPIDIDMLRGTIWPECRGTRVGTVEWRSFANQPNQESTMAAIALELGLVSNLGKATEMVREYKHKQIVKGREGAIKDGMRAKIGNEPVTAMINKMLDIAEEGLRNVGEDPSYLAPLLGRMERGINPADEILEVFERQGRDGLLDHATLLRTE